MGNVVKFKAYEGIFYVTNGEDSAYQQLNLYIPLDTKVEPTERFRY